MWSSFKACASLATQWLSKSDNSRRLAWLVLAFALLVRLAGLVVAPSTHVSTNAKESIIAGAALIRSGNFVANPDYPMLIPPLTGLVLAAVQSVFGEGLMAMKVLQVILDSVVVVVVFQIGKQTFSQLVGAIAAMLLSVYPFAVFVPLYIGTEAIFSFCLALFILYALRGLEAKRPGHLLVAGLFLGLATLSRGTTLYLPVFVLALLAWTNRRQSAIEFAKQVGAFVVGFTVIIGPWTARNLVVLGAPIPTSIAGMPLLYGSSEDFWIISERRVKLPEYEKYLAREKNIALPSNPTWTDKDRWYTKAAIEKYRERWEQAPASFAPFLLKKFARLWYGTESGTNETLVLLVNAPFYVLCLVGLWYSRDSPRIGTRLILVVLLYFVVLHMAAFAYFRYVAPVMPYVILFAANGIQALLLGRLAPRNSTGLSCPSGPTVHAT